MTDFAPQENLATPKETPIPAKIVPPYNGFGSEQDSLCNCAGLIMKPPQRDFKKFMEKDRKGLISHVLRFVAVMDTDYTVDKSRRFIVSFYLSDDTIAVFEPPQRNSGVLGGKYLERGRVKLPGQEIFKSELTKYYTASDFYVGAKLMFNDITFIIVGADEYGEQIFLRVGVIGRVGMYYLPKSGKIANPSYTVKITSFLSIDLYGSSSNRVPQFKPCQY